MRAVIAALLSLLVFPGTGHVWLKHKKSGFGIIAISLACLAYLIITISKVVMTMIDDVANGRIAADVVNLSDIVHQQLSSGNNSLLGIASTLLTVCWLGSAVDAFRLGMKK